MYYTYQFINYYMNCGHHYNQHDKTLNNKYRNNRWWHGNKLRIMAEDLGNSGRIITTVHNGLLIIGITKGTMGSGLLWSSYYCEFIYVHNDEATVLAMWS